MEDSLNGRPKSLAAASPSPPPRDPDRVAHLARMAELLESDLKNFTHRVGAVVDRDESSSRQRSKHNSPGASPKDGTSKIIIDGVASSQSLLDPFASSSKMFGSSHSGLFATLNTQTTACKATVNINNATSSQQKQREATAAEGALSSATAASNKTTSGTSTVVQVQNCSSGNDTGDTTTVVNMTWSNEQLAKVFETASSAKDDELFRLQHARHDPATAAGAHIERVFALIPLDRPAEIDGNGLHIVQNKE